MTIPISNKRLSGLAMITALLLTSRTSSTTDVETVTVQGIGETVSTQVYVAWMAAYRAIRSNFVDVRMMYESRESGYGYKAIMNELGDGIQYDYAGLTTTLTNADYALEPDLQMFPSLTG